MFAALAAARFVHYAATTGLFGLALFAVYAGPRRLTTWMAVLAFAALASAWAWLALVTADLAGSLDLDSLTSVAMETDFGRVWVVRLVLALFVLGTLGRPGPWQVALSGLLLGSIALTGHTQIDEGARRAVHVALDAGHLLSAGLWLGGLTGLVVRLDADEDAVRTVDRFSRLAMGGVLVLAASGVGNGLMMLKIPDDLIASLYGRLVLAKFALFAAMGALAFYNRLKLTPALAAGPSAAAQLRRNALVEQGLGLVVLACVAVLGMSEPP